MSETLRRSSSSGKVGRSSAVGEEIEAQIEVLSQHGEGQGAPVAPGFGLETPAHELDRAIELGPRARRRASGQELGGEVGEARGIGRIEDRPRAHVGAHDHDGNGGARRDEEPRPARQHLSMSERRRDAGGGQRPDQEQRHHREHASHAIASLPGRRGRRRGQQDGRVLPVGGEVGARHPLEIAGGDAPGPATGRSPRAATSPAARSGPGAAPRECTESCRQTKLASTWFFARSISSAGIGDAFTSSISARSACSSTSGVWPGSGVA